MGGGGLGAGLAFASCWIIWSGASRLSGLVIRGGYPPNHASPIFLAIGLRAHRLRPARLRPCRAVQDAGTAPTGTTIWGRCGSRLRSRGVSSRLERMNGRMLSQIPSPLTRRRARPSYWKGTELHLEF